MNPRMEWLAREVLPVLYGLSIIRSARRKEVAEVARKAKADELAARDREAEADRALSELTLLLRGVGYTDAELDTFARGPTPPPEATPLCECVVPEVPL